MKWGIQTIARPYIEMKQNNKHLEQKMKLGKLSLEETEQAENNVGHNNLLYYRISII